MVKYIFGPGNINWHPTDMKYNIMFIRAQEAYADAIFKEGERLSFDDVLNSIGIPIDPKMPFTGWRKGMGDDFVGFGIRDYNPDNIDPNVGIELSFNVEVPVDVMVNF